MSLARLLPAVVVLGVIAQASSHAQAPRGVPDFSGTWVATSPAQVVAGNPLGLEGTIEQTASTLTLTSSGASLKCRLDGAVEESAVNWFSNGSTVTSRAHWATNALVIAKDVSGYAGQWEDLTIVSLDVQGNLNVVQLNAMLNGPNAMSTHLVTYRRK